MFGKGLGIAVCATLTLLLVATDARAYVDPNAAGLLYQIFFPVIIAVTVAWRWIKETVKQLFGAIRSAVIRRSD